MSDEHNTDPKFLDAEAQRLPKGLNASLTVIEGQDKGQQFNIVNYETGIGRKKNDITINDSSASRQHARIVFEAGNFFVEDLNSANGSYVNGKRIGKKQLQDRDHIKLGDTIFSFNLTRHQAYKENETDPSMALPDEDHAGERKFVTVLFADISGFSGIAQQMDPEELTSMVNGCFERLIKIAYKHRGTVDKLIGDCVMVLFGAPLAHEDDTERALICAMEMIQAVEQFGEKIGRTLKIAIGINAGNVLAGNVGSQLKRDYTVMGNAVNLAQKLQKQATAGEIRVSADVVNLTNKSFLFEAMPPFQVRGIDKPIHQYRLLGLKQQQNLGMTSNVTRQLVGRRQELLTLKQSCDHVVQSNPLITLLCGESGIGKSRLGKEIYLYALAKGLRPYRVVARSIDTGNSYGLIFNVIRALMEIGTDGSPSSYDDLYAEFLKYGLSEDEVRFVFEIFPENYQFGKIQDLPAQSKMQEVYHAVTKLLVRLLSEGPTFLHFDSLQWADLLSLNILKRLIQKIHTSHANMKLFMLLSCRDAETVPFQVDAELKLGPLPHQEGVELIRKIFAEEQASASVIETIYQRSGGNPLFIEEIISSIHEQKGRTDANKSLTISANLTSILQARIDRLTPTSKETLKYAAAMGNDFDPRLLCKITGQEEQTLSALSDLVANGFIDEINEFSPQIFGFHNPMIREVAINSMLKEKQRKIAKRVAIEMEKALSNPRESSLVSYAMLAEYFVNANDFFKAVDYFGKAADSLAGNGDNRTAMHFYEKAITIIDKKFPDQHDLHAQQLIKLAQLTSSSDGFKPAFALLERAHNLLTKNKNKSHQRVLFLVFKEMGRLQRLHAQFDAAEKTLTQVISQLKADDDVELFIETMREIGVVHFQRGSYDQALNFYHQALQKAKAQKDYILIARCLNEIGLVHYYKGQMGNALNFFLESLQLREASGNLHAVAVVLPNIADAYHNLGESSKALEHLDRTIQITRKIGDRRTYVIAAHNLADILIEQGKLADAATYHQNIMQIADELGFREAANLSRIQYGYILTLQNDLTKGRQLLDRALQEAIELKNTENEIQALTSLAVSQHKINNHTQAQKLFLDALTRSEQIGNLNLIRIIKARMKNFPIPN